MTVGELKKLIESEGVTDDFEIDIMGEFSKGSFGTPSRVEKRIVPFPDNEGWSDYKELQLFIDA